MRYALLLLSLLLALAPEASASTGWPFGKKKNRRAATEQVQPASESAPAAEPAGNSDPQQPQQERAEEINDITLALTAEQADSLVAVWHEQLRADSFNEFFDRYIGIDSLLEHTGNPASDSLYARRLQALVSPVPLAYNDVVRDRINLYVGKQRDLTARILGISEYYFPLIEEELLKADLPIELRAIPIIESALIPTATSRAGAVGLWQFMPPTGKSYGLEINSVIDERRDPIRSTQAAVRYFRDLYNLYGDWTLAIAAYNCGPGNVNKAIARSGQSTDKPVSFWDIYPYLPHETRGYVPAFIAATYAYAYHRQHDIDLRKAPIPLAVDTVHVHRLLHFGQIASTIDLPVETLRQLNPQYKLDIVPATTKPYALVLPQRNIAQYIAHESEIFAKDSLYLKEYLNPANLTKKMSEAVRSKTYVVKKGDTLGSIAKRHRVTVKQLMTWNKLKNANSLRIGQRLRVG